MAVSALLLAGTATSFAAPAIVVPPPAGESWAAELALEGGDDSGVLLADGGVRPVPTPGSRPEGVLTVAPRRLLAPAAAVAGTVTADLPPGTSVDLQIRGLDRDGRWGPWLPARDGAPARFATPTSEVQVRLLLHGTADGSAVPAARGTWLTAEPAGSAAPTTPTSAPPGTGTTTIPTDQARPVPTTTAPATSPTTPTTPAAGLIWDGAIATTGLGGFKDTPYNITGSSTVKVLDGPPRTIRFTVPSGS